MLSKCLDLRDPFQATQNDFFFSGSTSSCHVDMCIAYGGSGFKLLSLLPFGGREHLVFLSVCFLWGEKTQ